MTPHSVTRLHWVIDLCIIGLSGWTIGRSRGLPAQKVGCWSVTTKNCSAKTIVYTHKGAKLSCRNVVLVEPWRYVSVTLDRSLQYHKGRRTCISKSSTIMTLELYGGVLHCIRVISARRQTNNYKETVSLTKSWIILNRVCLMVVTWYARCLIWLILSLRSQLTYPNINYPNLPNSYILSDYTLFVHVFL